MKTKPDLGFWKLWDLSFGFFGVQIAYALQSANVSRIFTTIGADPHDLSYFWILPPLMGLIVQPIVGILSDRTWTKIGRRLPYLIIGATIAVIVMCLLPNSGSFQFTVSSAILFGLIALMLLDTSINMAMQPFKMLVGDMVNEKQKGLAYSIQSFLCNAGSVVGYIFPLLLGFIGLKNVAPSGVVPDTVIWSFYIGASILLLCVVYSLVKIKEWPPAVYNEYNGIEKKSNEKQSANVFKLLKNAPSTFWTVGLVQFFCWFAFLFLWTYATNTVAHNAFDTPEMQSVVGIKDGDKVYNDKNILINDKLAVSHGNALIEGVKVEDRYYSGGTIVANGNDTLVANHTVLYSTDGVAKAKIGEKIAEVKTLTVDGVAVENPSDAIVCDYLSQISGPAEITTAAIVANGAEGKYQMEDAKTYKISNISDCSYVYKTVLNSATNQYNDAGNWVGLLYAIQAIGSVIWAVLLPRFRSRKFSYSLSLLLGAAGFIMLSMFTNKWMLFLAFILIGCAWAAMLAWPFTILTNSLKGGNIGAYLGLFNGTICLPQIVAALAGGWILSMFSTPGQLAPEYLMMMVAGISIALGSICVFFIREGKGTNKVEETPLESEGI